MYYSHVEIEYVAMSFSPARTDLALKLLTKDNFAALTKLLFEWMQQECIAIAWQNARQV
jgi:hypothetical protein